MDHLEEGYLEERLDQMDQLEHLEQGLEHLEEGLDHHLEEKLDHHLEEKLDDLEERLDDLEVEAVEAKCRYLCR